MRVVRLLAMLVACVAFFAAPSYAQQGRARGAGGFEGTDTSPAAIALKQDMRKLWTDHVVWTRDYIIAAVGDQPDAMVAANRLMKNQEDIGAAVATYYGSSAGQQLTTLLKDHISIAADLIKAAKAGDKTAQQNADTKWQQNATQIADLLSKANPNWPRATLVDMMKMHLSTTTTEVVARLQKDWSGDVRAFDAVYDHILHMADALTDGIVKQFPEKFRRTPVATSGVR
jgi:prophage DNA circulation protein